MTYSTEAVELYNYAVNEAKIHPLRQSAAELVGRGYVQRAAGDYLSIVNRAVRSYENGFDCPIFTCEHILEAALMLHREDMKAVAEDRLNGGKGDL